MTRKIAEYALAAGFPLAVCFGLHTFEHGWLTWATVAIVFYAAFLCAMFQIVNTESESYAD